MKNLYFFIIILLSLLFFSFNNSDEKNKQEKKIYKKAQREYNNGNYKVATNLYLELLKIDSCNFDYNYELALLFFYELNKKAIAIKYFETASQYMKDDAIPNLYNYLGQAYYASHRYEDAIGSYMQYSKFPPKEGFIKISMKKYIKKCEVAKERIKEYERNKKEYGIINLGPNINSEYPEYSAFKIFSDSVIIFNTLRDFDIDFNQYIETIYFSQMKNEECTIAKKILEIPEYNNIIIGNLWHEAAISITNDETQIIVHKKNKLWVSNFIKGVWQKPVKFSKNINSNYSQEHASISGDGNKIFFSSSDKKTKNIDIYMSVKQCDGKWGKSIKLGTEINTESNEDCPEISKDGNTLYFSSKGHNSKGGYDIFKSTFVNGKWTKAENIDSLNSTKNDMFYKYNKNNNVAFFSSDRDGGFGDMDIYMVKFKK
ncbi:MAG: PD40 domain-containing protein [Bacteroidetes bacterium]|nr:PD40 domain-containing protein [Bacteroidota bacterium]